MENIIEQRDKTVTVVPASEKYERQDIETAVNNALNDGYIVDRIVRKDNYVFVYFKLEKVN